MEQGQNVLLVSAALRHLNIFDNHVSNDLTAMRARQQVLSECCCGDLRQVLVLSNSEYLLLGQTAQANAIFQSDHGARPAIFTAKLHLRWGPISLIQIKVERPIAVHFIVR